MAHTRKAVAAAITAAIAAATTALLDGHLDKIELIGVGMAALAAGVAVYLTPNKVSVE